MDVAWTVLTAPRNEERVLFRASLDMAFCAESSHPDFAAANPIQGPIC